VIVLLRREIHARTWQAKAQERWAKIKAVVKFLYLHIRAVRTANHPLRKRARGEFEVTD